MTANHAATKQQVVVAALSKWTQTICCSSNSYSHHFSVFLHSDASSASVWLQCGTRVSSTTGMANMKKWDMYQLDELFSIFNLSVEGHPIRQVLIDVMLYVAHDEWY